MISDSRIPQEAPLRRVNPVEFLGLAPALVARSAGSRAILDALKTTGIDLIGVMARRAALFPVETEWEVRVCDRKINDRIRAYDLRIGRVDDESYFGVSFMCSDHIMSLTYNAHFADECLDMLQCLDEKMAAYVDEARVMAVDILVDGTAIADEMTRDETTLEALKCEQRVSSAMDATEIETEDDLDEIDKLADESEQRMKELDEALVDIVDAEHSVDFAYDHKLKTDPTFNPETDEELPYVLAETDLPYPLGCFAGLYLACAYLEMQMHASGLDIDRADDNQRDWRSIARLWDRMWAEKVIYT